MNTFRKFIIGIAALTVLGGFTSCQDDFDDKKPGFDIPKATLTPNTSILELKEAYWQNTVNYIDQVGLRPDGSHYIISGRVISSDRMGNVYKKLVIQDKTAALALSINANSLYNTYRVGQEIVIDATDMYIGKYNGTQQLGFPLFYEKNQVWEATFMPLEFFVSHMQLNGLPNPAEIDTITIRNFSALPSDPAQLPEYQSQLVRFNNVYFVDGGTKNFTDGFKITTNRILKDKDDQSMTVRTSGYALFREQQLPAGNGDVVAILDYYKTSDDSDSSPWQLTLIDNAGCMNFGNPTMEPGDEDNPYTVEQIIALESASNRGNGWMTGYIVGAVAPEVTVVGSNDDIEWGSEVTLANTLVIAPAADVKDYQKCVVVYLEQDSPFRQYGNLRDNPSNLGKQIWLTGTFEKFMGTWGIINNSGATSQWKIEGVTPEGGEIPSGDGSEASPYSVSQIVAMNPTSTTDAVAKGVWVSGYIVGSMPTGGSSTVLSGTQFGLTDAAETNFVIAPTADCTDYKQCIGIQLPTSVRGALNLKANPGNLGAKVSLYGDVMKYCGGPGLKNTSKYVINGGGGDTPVTPPSGDAKGDGSLANPFNAVAANEAAAAGSTAEVYVEGIVSSIKEISTSFGNATYYISEDGSTTNQFYIYRGNYLGGKKFTSESQLKVGDKVVVKGSLMNYMGNSPQLGQGNQLVSINGSSTGGDTPVTPPTPPSGENSKENPYTCEQVRAFNPTSTTEAAAKGVWMKGYIVGYMPASGTYLDKTVFGVPTDVMTNIVVGPTPDCTDASLCVGIQLPKGSVRDALNLQNNNGNLGKEVLLFGDVMKYCGGPGLKNTSQYELK